MLSTRLRAVLFDLDGVLIDSRRAWHRVIVRGRHHFGYAPVPYEQFETTFGQGIAADRRDFFPRQTVEQVETFYGAAFADELAAVDVMDGAVDVLREVGARGLRRAIVTNTPLALARRILAHKDIADHVESLAAAGEAADKPAPDLVLLALARVGVRPEAALYVGDSPTDVEAARAAHVAMAGLGIAADLHIARLADLLAHLPDRR